MSEDTAVTDAVEESPAEESFEQAMEALAMEESTEVASDDGTSTAPAPPAPEATEQAPKPAAGGDLSVALRQARNDHAAQIGQMNQRFEERFQQLAQVVQRAVEPPPEDEQRATIEEDPERFIRQAVDQAIEPLIEGQHDTAEREEELALQDLGQEISSFVAEDYQGGVARYGEQPMAAAIEHVVGEEIRGIMSRNPGATQEQAAQHFADSVLPSLQFLYAREGQSLTDMAMQRAVSAGAVATGTNGAPAAPAQPEGRISATPARPSLSEVSGRAPSGAPTFDEMMTLGDKEWGKKVTAAGGFEAMMQGQAVATPDI